MAWRGQGVCATHTFGVVGPRTCRRVWADACVSWPEQGCVRRVRQSHHPRDRPRGACVCMCVHVCACVCMCVHVYACVCVCRLMCVRAVWPSCMRVRVLCACRWRQSALTLMRHDAPTPRFLVRRGSVQYWPRGTASYVTEAKAPLSSAMDVQFVGVCPVHVRVCERCCAAPGLFSQGVGFAVHWGTCAPFLRAGTSCVAACDRLGHVRVWDVRTATKAPALHWTMTGDRVTSLVPFVSQYPSRIMGGTQNGFIVVRVGAAVVVAVPPPSP